MNMKECQACGKILKDSEKYCPDCGATFEEKKNIREEYVKFYMNLPTKAKARREMLVFFSCAAVLSFFVFSIQLLFILSGEPSALRLLWLMCPTVWIPACLAVYFLLEIIVGCKTNYFCIDGDSLVLNISFKRKTLPISCISGVVLAENKNLLKGPLTFGKMRYRSSQTRSLREKVLGITEKESGKVLFYTLPTQTMTELFASLGFSVPKV